MVVSFLRQAKVCQRTNDMGGLQDSFPNAEVVFDIF